ncbi:CLIPC1 [Trypoxylus dichotomus]
MPVKLVRRFLKVVRLGTKNIFTPESTYMDYNISEKILHPHYRSNLRYNDIGLLRLSTRVIFTPKIKPACLHVTTDFNDNTLVASGWGKQGTFGDLSPHLLKVHLVLNSYDACNRTFGSQQRVLPQGIDPLSMICAAGRQNEIKDTCELILHKRLQLVPAFMWLLKSQKGGKPFSDGEMIKECVNAAAEEISTLRKKYVNKIYEDVTDGIRKELRKQNLVISVGEATDARGCQGDSGGPLQISNDFYDFVVGITSFGFPCSLPNIASVYTRTSDYIGWIEDIVWQ